MDHNYVQRIKVHTLYPGDLVRFIHKDKYTTLPGGTQKDFEMLEQPNQMNNIFVMGVHRVTDDCMLYVITVMLPSGYVMKMYSCDVELINERNV